MSGAGPIVLSSSQVLRDVQHRHRATLHILRDSRGTYLGFYQTSYAMPGYDAARLCKQKWGDAKVAHSFAAKSKTRSRLVVHFVPGRRLLAIDLEREICSLSRTLCTRQMATCNQFCTSAKSILHKREINSKLPPSQYSLYQDRGCSHLNFPHCACCTAKSKGRNHSLSTLRTRNAMSCN
eukprot:3419871-Rhodomonas_salina.3